MTDTVFTNQLASPFQRFSPDFLCQIYSKINRNMTLRQIFTSLGTTELFPFCNVLCMYTEARSLTLKDVISGGWGPEVIFNAVLSRLSGAEQEGALSLSADVALIHSGIFPCFAPSSFTIKSKRCVLYGTMDKKGRREKAENCYKNMYFYFIKSSTNLHTLANATKTELSSDKCCQIL